nr:hypothetical protein [Tanacetum cinerariifolium]
MVVMRGEDGGDDVGCGGSHGVGGVVEAAGMMMVYGGDCGSDRGDDVVDGVTAVTMVLVVFGDGAVGGGRDLAGCGAKNEEWRGSDAGDDVGCGVSNGVGGVVEAARVMMAYGGNCGNGVKMVMMMMRWRHGGDDGVAVGGCWDLAGCGAEYDKRGEV